MINNKVKLTPEKALELSINVWEWLYKHPSKNKDAYPDYRLIRNYPGECPLCEIYWNDLPSMVRCVQCPLYEEGITCCTEWNIWFDEINDAMNEDRKVNTKLTKKNAKLIYEKLLAYRRKSNAS